MIRPAAIAVALAVLAGGCGSDAGPPAATPARPVRIALLDSVIITVAAATVQWVFFVEPYAHSSIKIVSRIVGIG